VTHQENGHRLRMDSSPANGHRPVRPLLVAVGDGDEREAALAYGAEVAAHEGRGLQLVHVVHPAVGVGVPETTLVPSPAGRLVGEGLVRRAAEQVRVWTGDQVPVDVIVREGAVVDVLLDMSRHVDGVILQHPQQSRVRRLVTGAVATGVATTSPVPVVSVPECWSPSSVPRITVAVHESAPDGALLDRAFSTAAARGGSLTVLHAWFLPSAYDDGCLDRAAVRAWVGRTREVLEENLGPWRSTYPRIDVQVEVQHERPADALLSASRDSSLLLLGRRDQVHPTAHLGSLTAALLRESLCPVEVVPQVSVADEPGEQLDVLDEVPVAEEPVEHTLMSRRT
jgi:nucleotide-binding universal stress UspA family protein